MYFERKPRIELKFQLLAKIGSLDTTVGGAAATHLAMAKSNIKYAEIVGPSRFKRDVAKGLTIHRGRVSTADGPGYGIS